MKFTFISVASSILAYGGLSLVWWSVGPAVAIGTFFMCWGFGLWNKEDI